MLLTVLSIVVGVNQYRVYISELEVQNYAIDHDLSLLNSELNGFINNLSKDSELLANSPVFSGPIRNLNVELARQALSTLVAFRPNYLSVNLLDSEGYALLSVFREGDDIRFRINPDSKPNPIVSSQKEKRTDSSRLVFINNYSDENSRTPSNFKLIIVEPIRFNEEQSRGYIFTVAEITSFTERLKKLISPQFEVIVLGQPKSNDRLDVIFDGSKEQRFAQYVNEEGSFLRREVTTWSNGQASVFNGCLYFRAIEINSSSSQPLKFLVGLNHFSTACNSLVRDAIQSGLIQISLAILIIGPLLWAVTVSKAHSKALHREVKKVNSQLKLITSEADLALLMVDDNLLINWMNPAAEKLLGWQMSELKGVNFHEKLHISRSGRSLHREVCPLKESLDAGEPYKCNKERLFTASGSLIYVSIRVRPFGDVEDRGAIIALAEVSELIREQKRLRTLATMDELTQCLNRRSIIEAITELANSSPPMNFSVIMSDIDHFKYVNDTYGHQAGDKVLIQFTSEIRSMLRETDVIGRLGGEEFILVLRGTSLADSVAITNKIRDNIENISFEIGQEKSIHITSSFGVASFDGQESVEQLMHRADVLLYEAKRRGRNRVEPQLNEASDIFNILT